MTQPAYSIFESTARSIAARHRIAPMIRETGVIASRLSLPEGTELYYKTENLQLTGSFKLRGASAKLSSLDKKQQVVTASSGNHGIACSLAAQKTGHKLTVVLPENVIDRKRETIESYGKKVVISGSDSSKAEDHARELARRRGWTYVSPYNDIEIVAGQGTIGLELLEQLSRIDNLFISMGGGGLISGIGAVIKSVSPQTRIIGVSAKNSAALAASIEAGEIVETEHFDTLADGIAGGVDPDSLTLPMAMQVIDDVLHFSEAQIAGALRTLAWTENMIVEGAAALALAPFLEDPERYRGKINVVLLCGANYDKERIAGLLTRSRE